MGFVKVGLHGRRFAIARNRLFKAPQGLQSKAQIEIGHRKIRLERNCLAIGSNRFFHAAEMAQHYAKVEMYF